MLKTLSANETRIMIFRTSILTRLDVLMIEEILNNHSQIKRWTIDLDDWEKVLKIEASDNVQISEIENIIMRLGHDCKELDH